MLKGLSDLTSTQFKKLVVQCLMPMTNPLEFLRISILLIVIKKVYRILYVLPYYTGPMRFAPIRPYITFTMFT